MMFLAVASQSPPRTTQGARRRAIDVMPKDDDGGAEEGRQAFRRAFWYRAASSNDAPRYASARGRPLAAE